MTTTSVVPGTSAWSIDPAHSNVEFSVRHLMIATVRGRFADVAGTVKLDESNPARASVDVTIQAASIDTRAEQRDTHLRSPDFFDVAKYPVITFKSRAVEPKGGDQLKVTGDLTMHGVTRPVTLSATKEGSARDPWGNDRIAFSAIAKLDRKEFGLTWNQALETGGVMVGDDIKITLDVELIRQVEHQ